MKRLPTFLYLLLNISLFVSAQNNNAQNDRLEKEAMNGNKEYETGREYEKQIKDIFMDSYKMRTTDIKSYSMRSSALEWYEKAAKKGHVEAQFRQGLLKENESPQVSVILYSNAGVKGSANADYRLALLLLKGIGVAKKDSVGAYYLLHHAALHGNIQAKIELDRLREKGILKKNKQLASAVQGNADSIKKLAEMYEKISTRDPNNYLEFLLNKDAAEKGNVHAMYTLVVIYEMGGSNRLMARDAATSDVWLEKAMKIGCAECSRKAGNYFWRKKGKASKRAYMCYLYAAEHGDAYAMGKVGTYLAIEETPDYDLAKAKMWLDKAIAGGEKEFEKVLAEEVEYKLYQQDMSLSKKTKIVPEKTDTGISDVDKNISLTNAKNENSFALIIANEKYEDVQNVPYAHNDGERFAEYCIKTLGMPDKNVRLVKDATRNDIKFNINWAKQTMLAYNGEAKLIFYYAGHGIPDEASKDGYLLPVDGIGGDLNTAYSLSDLYSLLNQLPSKATIVMLDACFSGALRSGEMLNEARGVALKTKATPPIGKMVVLTAASGDETAAPYESNKHGMFTYYILKKLQETRGEVTLGELSDYVTKVVKQNSLVENGKLQTPSTIPSNVSKDWRNWKLK